MQLQNLLSCAKVKSKFIVSKQILYCTYFRYRRNHSDFKNNGLSVVVFWNQLVTINAAIVDQWDSLPIHVIAFMGCSPEAKIISPWEKILKNFLYNIKNISFKKITIKHYVYQPERRLPQWIPLPPSTSTQAAT